MISKIPLSLQEQPVDLPQGTHDVPTGVIGCIVTVAPKSPTGGTGHIDLTFNNGAPKRYWSRDKGGGTGHGHTFGVTVQVFFPVNSSGQYPTEVTLEEVGYSGDGSIIAWIKES